MNPEDFASVRSAVREFVHKRVIPAEQEIEDGDAIPERIRKGAAELGLFGYALPEEYGGLGLNMSEDVQLAFEFGYTVPAFRSLFGTNNGIAGQIVNRFGTEDQKRKFLPGMASGELIAAFALTEAEAGSDPAGLRTRARADGEEWVITGQKRYITNAAASDLLLVFARTDPDSTGGRGISVFIVERDRAGVVIGPKDQKMGQKGAWTSEVSFDEVRVPADHLVGGEPGRGYSNALTVLSRGRLHIAALCVGMAQRVLEDTTAHAAVAQQGGAPIGRFQLVQAMIAECYAELTAGRAMVVEAALAYDDGSNRTLGPSAAKLYCSEMLGRVSDRGVQVFGGAGYMHTTSVERIYRDARLYRIYEGTSEIQKLIIGRQLLRENGFSDA